MHWAHCSIAHFQVPKTLTLTRDDNVIISSIFIRIKTDFRITCFALNLALKQRLEETRKWPSHSTATGWQAFLFPIKFQHYASCLLLLLTFWGTSSVIKLSNWMHLFPMNKSASWLPSRTIRIKLTIQMMHKTNGLFVLLKKLWHVFVLNSSTKILNVNESRSKVYVTKGYTVIHRVFKFLFLFFTQGIWWALSNLSQCRLILGYIL